MFILSTRHEVPIKHWLLKKLHFRPKLPGPLSIRRNKVRRRGGGGRPAGATYIVVPRGPQVANPCSGASHALFEGHRFGPYQRTAIFPCHFLSLHVHCNYF